MQNYDLIQYLTTRKHRQRVSDAIAAITALKTIEGSRQPPTPAQRLAMLKFPGFGSICSLFSETDTTQWEVEARLYLSKMLTPEEYTSARRTILNQHQTDPRLIGLLWQTLQQFGFTGGNVFDPGCSVGWMGEFRPAELKPTTRMVGVEIDGLSARFAKQVNPNNIVHHRAIQAFNYPVGQLDAAVMNPPFGDGVFAAYNGMKFKIGLANWVMAKTLDLLKPGALMIAVVGSGVLDGIMVEQAYLKFREWLDRQAVFLGAVRLPIGTFEAIANTCVGTDIIIMQKRHSSSDTRVSEPFIEVQSYLELTSVKTDLPVYLNEYFWKYPEHMLGKPALCPLTGDRFATSWDFKDDLWAAIERALDDIVMLKEHLVLEAG